MDISQANVKTVIAQQIGNILKKGGIDTAKSTVKLSDTARKHLGRMIVRLQDKCIPCIPRKNQSEYTVTDILTSAVRQPDRLTEKALLLGTRLYETGDHIQIPDSVLLTILFDGTNDAGEPLNGIVLLAFAPGNGNLAFHADEEGKTLDYIEIIDEPRLERVAIWHDQASHVMVVEKKNITVKYWIEKFLALKPALTENKATAVATQLIKKVADHIDSARQSTEYKQKVNEMLDQASTVSFEELQACSRQYLDEDTFNSIRDQLEQQTSLSLNGAYELPAQTLHKKVREFVKTMRLTPQLDVTIKGKQEVVSMEQLSSEETDTILIKLKLKERE